jgi:transcriptional regulator with XRE-family HTH domain
MAERSGQHTQAAAGGGGRDGRGRRGARSPHVDDLPAFGPEIRALRKRQGMTLADLAAASGLSISFLSQVERDSSNLSVDALYRVSRALGVNIMWFFHAHESGSDGERHHVVRRALRRQLRYGAGISDELLLPHLDGKLAFVLTRMAPGASSGREAKITSESEHAGLVLDGVLELVLDQGRYLLEAGDSFWFPGDMPHRYANPGDKDTTIAWAITPPSY